MLKSSSVIGAAAFPDEALSNSTLTWPSPSAAASVADSNCSCEQLPATVRAHSTRVSAGISRRARASADRSELGATLSV